ncbi:MAG: alpha-glucan family phosphorylase [Chitinophagales bacterium]|nr:alpha-glucan family phosphorylase [Chitinophagales bacterium]
MNHHDFLIEISWEVCHKIGGIYTVLGSKLPALLRQGYADNLLFIGPDVWKNTGSNPDFREDRQLFRAWREHAAQQGLRVKVGHWQLPEKPTAILVDFTPYFHQKDDIFTHFWDKYRLDSISGDWDYIEPALFGYAAAQVAESFAQFYLADRISITAQFHEWMTGAGILHLHEHAPYIATIFTTHATVLGRALSAAQQPIYSHLEQYSPDITAKEHGVTAKHSLERAAAQNADCFTTVSELCAKECAHFLGKRPDMITPNGFEPHFSDSEIIRKHAEARQQLLEVAAAVCQTEIAPNALLLATAGRYEYRNKGFDIIIQALGQIVEKQQINTDIVAFFLVPAAYTTTPIPYPLNKNKAQQDTTNTDTAATILTHHLQNPDTDPILNGLEAQHLDNAPTKHVKVIFVPTYLKGNDGIFNRSYYDLLCGFDLTLFPSAYDPWGYTPLESLALHVPTLTTTMTGFGQWVMSKLGKPDSGIHIIERSDEPTGDQAAATAVEKSIIDFAALTTAEQQRHRETARSISRIALWENLIDLYKKAYQSAQRQAKSRSSDQANQSNTLARPTQKTNVAGNISAQTSAEPVKFPTTFKRLLAQAQLPKRLQSLADLAHNLWWCWTHEAIQLFERINPEIWRNVEQNPIALLDQLDNDDYLRLLADAQFMTHLDRVAQQFADYMQAAKQRPANSPKIAYFCMEYGLHHSVRLYSGGLGVLAGDYLKEASDCNTDMIAIGLLYRYGYFTQTLSPNGEQIAQYDAQRFSHMPLKPVKDENGNWVKIAIALPRRTLYAKIWRLDVGRVPLYLLDSEITENNEFDRSITHRLYGGDNEMRLLQEILLGIGGIRALTALNIKREIYHLNEGHAAFAGLERLYHEVQDKQASFDEALEIVRASSVFTTHTPVPAGHDAFSEELMRAYFSTYDEQLGITWNDLINLGREHTDQQGEKFSMSNLAVRLSKGINGVSAIHGKVSRQMFAPLFAGWHTDEVPIGHVTNGVHYPTWIAKQMHDFYVQNIGSDFIADQSNKQHWAKIYDAPDDMLYNIHWQLKSKLIAQLRQNLRSDFTRRLYNPRLMLSILQGFDENTLLIGFARRFATYKRATLLLHDLDRLRGLLNHPTQPVRFVFAGKAHPADSGGQAFIRQLVEISLQPDFLGKILFVENYDMELARSLVQGVDVWLNNPTRPQEASGTSGMKAALNGIPNLSVLDGWWAEGYVEGGGWALPEQNTYDNADFQNELDAQTIYNLIENEIAPLYYKRNSEGIPTDWVRCMKTCIAEIAPQFTMKRQLDDYTAQYYNVQQSRSHKLNANNRHLAHSLAAWKQHVRQAWHTLQVVATDIHDSTNHSLTLGDSFTASITLNLNALLPSDLRVEAVFLHKHPDESYEIAHIQPMPLTKQQQKIATYTCQFPFELSGVYDYGFRAVADHLDLKDPYEVGLVKWI